MHALAEPPGRRGRSSERASVESVRWRVLHTRSRQEKAVVETLDAAGVEHYLPLVRRTRRYARSGRVVEMPLFPGYVFLRGTREQAFLASGTGRIANIIETADQDRLERELRSLRLALEVTGALDPYPFLGEGRAVRVRSGPFKGVEGVVERYEPATRLVLQVRTLGQAASLEIDPAILEPAD